MDDQPTVQVHGVMINTTDASKLAKFWSQVLGVGIRNEAPGYIFLHPQRKGGVAINFQQVSNPTEGRRRLHIDASVSDLEQATKQIIELGGAHLDDQEVPDFAWRVMADPDGNEFCIAQHE